MSPHLLVPAQIGIARDSTASTMDWDDVEMPLMNRKLQDVQKTPQTSSDETLVMIDKRHLSHGGWSSVLND